MENCEMCGGEGYIVTANGADDFDQEVCAQCDGVGLVEVVTF